VVACWPGSVHDMRVFKDAIEKFKDKFLFSPQGIHLFHLHNSCLALVGS